jgi:hypothetical protein
MTFAPKPFEAIYAELVNSTQTRLKDVGTRGEGIDLAVGSVIRTLYESFAYEMALLYEQMDQVYQSAFIDTASGLQLEMVAAILGIQRGLPDYAEGVVTFTRDMGQDDIEIPIGTLVTTEDSAEAPRKAYTTLEARLFPATNTEVTVKVQAMERGEKQMVAANSITVMPLPVAGVKAVRNDEATQFLGKRLETDDELRQRAKSVLLASGKASLSAIETALLSLPGVREVKVVEPGPVGERENYGVLDIYIDDRDLDNMPPSGWLPQSSLTADSSSPSGPDPDEPATHTISPTEQQRQQTRVATLRQKIDQVRAAGVYVRLHGAELVWLDGMVQIEVEATADPETVTAAVKTAIATHLARLPLGRPLLFPPLVQAMLAVPGVANMDEFALVPHWPNRSPDPDQAPDPVMSSAKRLDPSPQGLSASKFRLGDLRVVSQPQNIPVRVEFWVGPWPSETELPTTSETEPRTTSEVEQAVLNVLKPWFQSTLKPGTPLVNTNLRDQIRESVKSRIQDLRLIPQNPSSLLRQEGETHTPGFAERFVLAEPLAIYDRYLDLVGALRVILPRPLTPDERSQTWDELRTHLQQFLDQWPPRQALSLAQLQEAANALLPGTELVSQDFRAVVSAAAVDRLDTQNQLIRVEPYERLRIGHLLISDRTEDITVTLTALSLTIRWLTDDFPSPPTVVRIRSDAPDATPTVSTDQPNAADRAEEGAAEEGAAEVTGDDPEETEAATAPVGAAESEEEPAPASASDRDTLIDRLKTTLRHAVTTFPAQPPGQDLDLATLHQHLANAPDRGVTFRRLDFTITGLVVTAVSGDGRSQTALFGSPQTATSPTDAPPTIHVRSLERVSKVTLQSNSQSILITLTTP